MVASPEQQRAPVIVCNPATATARSNQPGAPLSRDDSADVIKIPEPIIEPITIMVASIGPSARTKPVLSRSLSTLSFIAGVKRGAGQAVARRTFQYRESGLQSGVADSVMLSEAKHLWLSPTSVWK